MLEVSGCLGNEKETSVGEIGEMYDSASVCGEWEKNEKYGHVNKSVKSICVYKKKGKKRKIIDTTNFEVDIVLERKRKKFKRIKER